MYSMMECSYVAAKRFLMDSDLQFPATRSYIRIRSWSDFCFATKACDQGGFSSTNDNFTAGTMVLDSL